MRLQSSLPTYKSNGEGKLGYENGRLRDTDSALEDVKRVWIFEFARALKLIYLSCRAWTARSRR